MPDIGSLPFANDNTDDTGIFLWNVEENVLFADSAIAHLFGLDPLETQQGLPIQDYLERVYPTDRPSLAQAIADAITSGDSYHAVYRVTRADGSATFVSAYGKCFFNRGDQRPWFGGIIFPMPNEVPLNTDLRWLCVAALEGALRDGRTDIVGMLREVIIKIGNAR